MGSPLPPDPYAALGVAKDAPAAAIKTAYRKLALKSHPDKFPDPAQKAEKAAEFHKIQQAYEILGDDDKRERYNAQVRLAELRKEHMERQQARGAATKTTEARPAAAANYDIRTPSGTTTYAAPRASRPYEESRSRPAYDTDYEEPQAKPRSTKYVYSRTRAASPPRVSRGVKIFFGGSNHSSRTKTRDQKEKRERAEKFVPVNNDSDSDERYRYEEARRRQKLEAHRQAMEEEDRRRKDEEDFRRRAEADRRRDEEMAREREASRRSSSRRPERDSYDKYLDQEQAAREHMSRHRGVSAQPEDRESVRPTPTSRSSKYAQVRTKKESSSKRSSEKSKDRILAGVKYGRGSREKERKSARATAESEYDEDPRRRPTLEKSDSSPANMRTAQRAATTDSYVREDAKPPRMRRAETMPAPSPAKSSHREEAKANTSKPRTELPKHVQHDSGYSSPSTSSSSEKERENKNAASSRKTTTTQYHYGPQGEGGVSVEADDDKYHTVTVEPPSSSGRDSHDSRKAPSRSPIREREREHNDDDSGRDAMPSGRTMHAAPNTTRYTYPVETDTRRPHMPRTTSTRNVPPAMSRSPPREKDRSYERGRSYVVSPDRARGYSHDRDHDRSRGSNTFFGEIPKQAGEPLRRDVPPVVRPTMRRGDSYTKQDVNYGRKYSMADVSYAPRSRERAPGVKHAYAFPDVDLGRPPLQRGYTMA